MSLNVQQFKSLFAGLSYAYLQVDWLNEFEEHPTGTKRKSRAFWVEHEATEKIYQEHLEGKHVLGISPVNENNLCRFGVIDIDQYNWSENRLNNLCNQIEKFEFPLVPARSKSQGVRLYLFCEPISGDRVKKYLKIAAALLGFTNTSSVEIFPKTVAIVAERGDKGAAITLPYFDMPNTICSAFWYDKALSFDEFLQFAQERICKPDDLKRIPTMHLENSEEFSDGPPCLQTLAVQGFAQGTRNHALINIAVYLRLRHGEDGAQTHLADYNDRFINPPVEEKELNQIIRSAKRKKYFYMCSKEPICTFCNKDLCLTRKYGVGNGFSDELNINISHITKYLTEPPIWILTINDHRVECETEDFIQIPRFVKLCIEKLNLIPNVPAKRLHALIQQALEKREEKEAPPDTTFMGRVIDLFERFLASRPTAKTKQEIEHGYPYFEDNHIYFRSKDFFDFLDLERVKFLEPRKVFKLLSDYAKNCQSEEPFNPLLRLENKVLRVWRIKHEKPHFLYEDKSEDF